MAVVLVSMETVRGDYVVTLNCDDTKSVSGAPGAGPVPDPRYQLVLRWGGTPPAGTKQADYEAAIQENARAIAALRAQELAG